MVHPVVLPSGGFSCPFYLKSQNENHKNNISTLQFYKYKFNIRDNFNPCLNLEMIVQKCIVDQCVEIKGVVPNYEILQNVFKH